MNQLDVNQIIFEVVKAVVLAFAAWLLKMNAEVRKLRKDTNMAFCKIRELEKQIRPS